MESKAVNDLIACQNCSRKLGEGTPCRPLFCSACLEYAYCSTTCQKQDWKEHQQICRPSDLSDSIRDRVLPPVTTTPFSAEEFTAFEQLVGQELCIALRSAYRFGHPDDLHESHLVQFSFDYDPNATSLRHRYIFRTATLEPYSSFFSQPENELRDVIAKRVSPEQLRKDAARLGGPATRQLVFGYLISASHTLSADELSDAVPCSCDPHDFESLLPLAVRKLNPNWIEHLRESLAGPPRTWEELDRADLAACEGLERVSEVEKRQSEEFAKFLAKYAPGLARRKAMGLQPLEEMETVGKIVRRQLVERETREES